MSTEELLVSLGFRELFMTVLLVFSIGILFILKRKNNIKRIVKKTLKKLIAAGIIWAGVIVLLLNLTSRLDPNFAQSYALDLGSESFYHLFVSAALVSPILEEFVFRYVLYDTFESMLKRILKHKNSNYISSGAIMLSAIIFAAAHLNPGQIMYALPSGIILGFIYSKNKNLLEPILFHSVFNLANVALFYAFSFM